MKCEKCIYYQARPALGNKFGWCECESITVSSEGTPCEHYEEEEEEEDVCTKNLDNLEVTEKLSKRDIDLKTEERVGEFRCAVTPLWEYLKKYYHPHTSVIVTPCGAEIFEGAEYVNNATRDCGYHSPEEGTE